MQTDPLDQTGPPPPPPTKMPLGKVGLINFVIILAYTVLLGTDPGMDGLGNMLTEAMLVALHAAINFFGGLVLLYSDQKNLGRAMVINGLLVAVIGFGICTAKYTSFR